MKPSRIGLLALVLGIASSVEGQTTQTYRPLGSWTDPASGALSRWEGELQSRIARATPVRAEARPQLAGLRPRSVELLEDGLLRKHPKLLKNSPDRARELLLRRVQRGRIHQLRGYMAEAILLDRNPQWGYVGKPNATQHDVYRWVQGQRPPLNGQVKYHDSLKPRLYARDMVKDHLAHRFFIPDDHVDATRAYLRASGRWHDANRVQPIGATSTEIRSATTEAARSLSREKYATYTSLGAALALSLGPTVYDWARGDSSANLSAYRIARTSSLFGAGYGTDLALRRIGQGALRGTVRGSAIVGTAIAITETAWLLHEHGLSSAFYQPEFYEQVVGGVSGLALGLSVGTYASILAAETGPIAAPLIGFGAGVLAGTVGYLGGSSAARAVMEIVSPEMLRKSEKQRLSVVKSSLDMRIIDLQNVSTR